MALSTNKVGTAAAATAGVAAAASSRVGHGGRNVASVTQVRVENASFAPNINVYDESILRHDEDERHLDSDGQRRERPQTGFTPFLSRAAFGFKVEASDEEAKNGERLFLTDLMRGVGTYESNMRVTTSGTVRPGSVMNYLY